MLNIAAIKQKRAADLAEWKSILTKETEDTPLSPEDIDRVGVLEKSVDTLNETVARHDAYISKAMEDAEPVKDVDDDDAMNAGKSYTPNRFAIKTADTIRVPRKKGEAVGRYAVAKWHVKENGLDSAKRMVEKTWGDAPVMKSLTLTTAQPIIPQDFSSEFIPLLTETSVVRSFADTRNTPRGNSTIPRQSRGSQGAYMTEGGNIATTAASFDNIQLTWHKYGALTYTTREMLQFSPLDAAAILTRDLANKLGLLEDQALLIGNGTNYPIHGILSSVNASNIFSNTVNASTAVDFQTVSHDLQVAELNLAGNFVYGNYVWVMSPFAKGFLKQLSSSFGVFPFLEELNRDMLNGFPVKTSRLLASNLGTSGANLTNILLVKADHAMIFDTYEYALSSTSEGSFLDGSTQVNTFGQDLVAWKMTNAHDFALMHDVSATVLQATNWTLGNTTAALPEYDQTVNTSASQASSAID